MQERQLGSTGFVLGDSYTRGDSGLRCSWEPLPLVLFTAQYPCRSLASEAVIQWFLYTQHFQHSVKSRVNGDCFSASGVPAGCEEPPRLWSLASPSISAVPRSIFCPPLMLQAIVTVLTDTHWGRDFQALDFWLKPTALLTEELPTVPAMVPPLCEGEAYGASRAAVAAFILHPVVSGRTTRLVTHRPAEHSASTVTHEDPAVILGYTQRGDLGWVRVVLSIKGCVHSQFASEYQLPLPPVPWNRDV